MILCSSGRSLTYSGFFRAAGFFGDFMVALAYCKVLAIVKSIVVRFGWLDFSKG